MAKCRTHFASSRVRSGDRSTQWSVVRRIRWSLDDSGLKENDIPRVRCVCRVKGFGWRRLDSPRQRRLIALRAFCRLIHSSSSTRFFPSKLPLPAAFRIDHRNSGLNSPERSRHGGRLYGRATLDSQPELILASQRNTADLRQAIANTRLAILETQDLIRRSDQVIRSVSKAFGGASFR